MSTAKSNKLASYTRINWWIDSVLFFGAVASVLTGFYFLWLPVGGYQGGRNPMYGVTIFFDRRTWDNLHTWFGIVMIVAALVHITVHWSWIVSMARRVVKELIRREKRLNARSRFNLIINSLIGICFLITSLSGICLLFLAAGRNGVIDSGFLIDRSAWDLLHTWAGILLIITGIVHFAIHWRWITKTTSKMLKSLWPMSEYSSEFGRV